MPWQTAAGDGLRRIRLGNLLSDIGKRLAYCQDAEVADWYAIDQLAPVYLHFENPY